MGIKSTYQMINRLRLEGNSSIQKFDKLVQIVNSSEIEQFNEKYLCLTISMFLKSQSAKDNTIESAVESLCKRLCVTELSLQGCNQVLGAFASMTVPLNETHLFVCRKILQQFIEKYLVNCPNREFSNIFWASCVLKLHSDLDPHLTTNVLESMDCADLALVCAGLMERPSSDLWPLVRADLLNRTKFTQKNIGSIMCSLACAGVNDRELIAHLVEAAETLLNEKNMPAIVWAISTCDFVHVGVRDAVVRLLTNTSTARMSEIDVRRISRAFALWGDLKKIEPWLMLQTAGGLHTETSICDSVLVWELVTNFCFESALKIFRNKPLLEWKRGGISGSQVYHLYLASLLKNGPVLSIEESNWLLSLQAMYADDDISSSMLHRQASNGLNELNISHVSEYKDPLTGYVLDIYIPSLKLGIEIQGPTHFFTNINTGELILRPPDKFKHEVLKSVSHIPILQLTPWNFGPKIKSKYSVQIKNLLAKRTL